MSNYLKSLKESIKNQRGNLTVFTNTQLGINLQKMWINEHRDTLILNYKKNKSDYILVLPDEKENALVNFCSINEHLDLLPSFGDIIKNINSYTIANKASDKLVIFFANLQGRLSKYAIQYSENLEKESTRKSDHSEEIMVVDGFYKGGMPDPKYDLKALQFLYKKIALQMMENKTIRKEILNMEIGNVAHHEQQKKIYLAHLDNLMEKNPDGQLPVVENNRCVFYIYWLTKLGVIENSEFFGMQLIYLKNEI
jgi:hypothetical protein